MKNNPIPQFTTRNLNTILKLTAEDGDTNITDKEFADLIATTKKILASKAVVTQSGGGGGV